MPATPLIDPQEFVEKPILFGEEVVRKFVPHRFEFALLDGVYQVDAKTMTAVGFYEVREDAFWTRGHIPGRPLMPGVLMIESCAQLCTFLFLKELRPQENVFMGFGGVNHARFRGTVVPPGRLITAVRCDKFATSRTIWTIQAFYKQKLVFEGEILALSLS